MAGRTPRISPAVILPPQQFPTSSSSHLANSFHTNAGSDNFQGTSVFGSVTDQKEIEGNAVVRRDKPVALSSLPTKEHFSFVLVNTEAT